MIISKPKLSTLMSLGIFLALAYGLGIWGLLSLPEPPVPMLRYLLPGLSLIVGLGLSIKILWEFQTIELKQGHWRVRYLIRPVVRKFNNRDIEWWKETQIMTKGGPYRRLHIHTNTGIDIKLSLQEHTSYPQILEQVSSKCPKKQIKDS